MPTLKINRSVCIFPLKSYREGKGPRRVFLFFPFSLQSCVVMFGIKEGNGEKRRKKRSDCFQIDDHLPRHLPLILPHSNSLPMIPYYLLPAGPPLPPAPAFSPGPLVLPLAFTLLVALIIHPLSFTPIPLLSPFPLALPLTLSLYPALPFCFYPLLLPLSLTPLLLPPTPTFSSFVQE